MPQAPHFLALEQVTAIHIRSLSEHAGSDDVRDAGGLESAVMQPLNVYHYLDGDLF
jgi:prophage maintenance system killer protein